MVVRNNRGESIGGASRVPAARRGEVEIGKSRSFAEQAAPRQVPRDVTGRSGSSPIVQRPGDDHDRRRGFGGLIAPRRNCDRRRPSWCSPCYRGGGSRHYAYSPYYGYGYRYGRSYYEPYYYPRTYVHSYVSHPPVYTAPREYVVEQVAQAPSTVYVDPAPVAAVNPPSIEPSAPVAVDAQPEPEISPLMEEGHAALRQSRYHDAQRFFLQAALEDKEDGFASLLYGVASFALGDYEISHIAIRRALESTPELLNDPIDLRVLFAGESELRDHLNRLADRATHISPPNVDHQFLLAYLYFSSGDPTAAAAVMENVLSEQPDRPFAAQIRDAARNVQNVEGAEPPR
jgi:tetratricopeptide (TPR) repeat protein